MNGDGFARCWVKVRGEGAFSEWQPHKRLIVPDAEVDHAALQALAMAAVDVEGWHQAAVEVDGARIYTYSGPAKRARRRS